MNGPAPPFQGHNYVRLLADLAAEQKFEVTHVEIEERTDEGETQCLVQLSCLPVTVCYGTGKDMASANQVTNTFRNPVFLMKTVQSLVSSFQYMYRI